MATKTVTLYYYKGSTFPLAVNETGGERKFEKGIVKGSLDMIAEGRKNGKSRADLIKLYKFELDYIEEAMFSTEQKYPNKTDQERMDIVCKELDYSQDFAHSFWCLLVNALMLLKAIENDNDNGLLVQLWYEPEEKKAEPKKEEPKKEEPKKEEPKKEEPKEDNEEKIVFKGWKQEMIDGWSNVE